MTIAPSKQTRKHRLLAAMRAMTWVLFGFILIPTQAIADPSWVGDPAATMQRFDFTTSAETVAPDVATNGFGIAAAVVEHFTPPGSGWQDPNVEFTAAGIAGGDGAWDLGPGGSIGISVPVSPTPPSGLSYDVEFYIEAVVYQGPMARPSLSITDQTIVGFNETATLLEEDAPGAYYLLTWTGVVPASEVEQLHYLVQAGGSAALVDSLEIHTRYTLNKTPAAVTLEGLTQAFDGNPKTVTATTVPLGLTVHITYDGSSTPPTNTGSYAVVATVDDAVYGGGASGLLQIANGSQTILFDSIPNQIATGTIPLAATGGASGNPVIFEVTSGPALIGPGNVLSFIGAGTVQITASQLGDMNYLPATPLSRTFTVSKADATVTLNSLSQTYDGTGMSVGVTTTPPGLTVDVTYDSDPTVPTAAGSYAVVATINDAIYEGTANGSLVVAKAPQTISFPEIGNQLANATVTLSGSGGDSGNPVTYAVDFGQVNIDSGDAMTFTGAGTVSVTASQTGGPNHLPAPNVTRSFVVAKAPATVTLDSLSATYDGTPKTAGATTVPDGLTVLFTYDGSSVAPSGAGDYAIEATIDDAIYEGTASGTLSLAKANQTLTFAAIADQLADATVNLTATGGGSTSPVLFVVDSGPAILEVGNVLTFIGTGEVSVTASQAADDNYEAATPVTQTFTVSKAEATVSLSGLGSTYDGDPKAVAVSTVPAGLTVNVTYDGASTLPTGAGSYAVEAVISDSLYEGSATGTLEIAKATQTIDFPAIAAQLTTATVNLAATGGDSNNDVIFAVTAGGGVASIAGGNVLTFTGAGTVSITATQAGNDNYLAATEVTRTFAVAKTPATINVTGLSPVYDGDSKPVTTSTAPEGLNVVVTYDGDLVAPVAAGSYVVVATIDDAIYEGTSVKALTVAKAVQVINFPQVGDLLATATVNLTATGGGSDSPVTFAVTAGQADIGAGNVLSFPAAGAVSVTASQEGDANYFPAADVTRTFNVTKASGTVVLGDLVQTYDGTPKAATATTTPPGLTVNFTYNGSATAPTQTGSYGVVATIADPIYGGSASGSFVIEKAPQVIEFPAIPDQLVSSVVNLTATGGGSGNPVGFAVTAGPGVITGGTVLTFTTAGTVSVTASLAEGPNHLAAADVTQTFEVEFSGYDAWRATEYPGETDPLIIGVSARPFGQALANGYRYYLGNAAYDPAVLISMGEEGGAWVFSHLRVEPTPEDALAVYEWSTDLVAWHGGGQSVGGLTVDFEVTSGALRPDERVPVEVRAIPSGSAPDRLFVRLKLTVPLTLP